MNLVYLGPVGVSIDASDALMHYVGGIFDGTQCSITTNHAVTLVGYLSGPNGYWIVRNSWGSTWGENGFIRLALGNTCGVILASNAASV